MFAGLMVTLLAGFGGIVAMTAINDKTKNSPGRRIPELKG